MKGPQFCSWKFPNTALLSQLSSQQIISRQRLGSTMNYPSGWITEGTWQFLEDGRDWRVLPQALGRSTNEERLGMTQRPAGTMLKRGLDLVFEGPWWDSRFLLSRSPTLEPQTMWGGLLGRRGSAAWGGRWISGKVRTCADGPGNFVGSTAVDRQAKVQAPAQVGLSPTHCMWSREMGPKPSPNRLLLRAASPAASTAPEQPAGPRSRHTLPPGAVVVDLHTAFTPAPAAGQPHHGQIYSPGPGQLEKLPSLLK